MPLSISTRPISLLWKSSSTGAEISPHLPSHFMAVSHACSGSSKRATLRFCRHQNDTAIFSALCCSRLACKTLSKCSLIKAQTSGKKVCKLSLEITSIVRMLNNKFSDDFLGGIDKANLQFAT